MDDVGDLVGGGAVRLDPRPTADVEDGGEPAYALGGVQAAVRVEADDDALAVVGLGGGARGWLAGHR
ncbi:hypothetical protein SPW_3597 [Streptomyces sp. W007]|nr:hypothetical protein SPW_3597 [Streptomyces sp. W007]